MIMLKDYQNRVLDSLKDFLRLCSKYGDPEAAFQSAQLRNFGKAVPYIPISAAGFKQGMPYVCLRVPTGGGKTLLACYAAGLAMQELLHTEHAVVLWLVPSNTILDQTLKALRDKNHPYRRALDMSCGQIEVVSIEEALHISRNTVEGQTVVIVSTIQSFRVEDQTGRKVYEENGSFSEHLLNLPADRIDDLIPGPDGKPKPSLVNILRLRRPIVIVDEAHNARTELSFSTLGTLLPSCIIEFTATPDRSKNPSNVLHRVSASELKEANMIKLPLRIVSRHPSQRDQLLADAIKIRQDLEKLAVVEGQKTGEYLRPIMLIQAERVDACEPLRERLVNEFGIARDQIIISTGTLDELKNFDNLVESDCPIRFIITVEKLREGWDCPFAYVLCSLKETRSATAIEQIVGRILRLPQAKAKLNCSYALSVSNSLPEVLNEFREALENNGFTAAESERIIIPVPQGALPLGVQPKTIHFEPGKEIDPDIVPIQSVHLAGKVIIDVTKGDITVLVPLSEPETEKLTSCVKTPEAKAKIQEIVEFIRQTEKAFGGKGLTRVPSPYELHLDFIVPLLCVPENGQLFEFDEDYLLEHEWHLSTRDASLSPDYNPLIRPDVKIGLIDVANTGKLETSQVSDKPDNDFIAKLHQNVLQLGIASDWNMENLVAWLDRHINHQDIPISESVEFLRQVIRGLMLKYNIQDINILAIDRFRLRDEIENKIQGYREEERKKAFQQYLLDDSVLTVNSERTINFKEMGYEPTYLYEGSYQFKKHYFSAKPGELNETSSSGSVTEEFLCAQYIDELPEVKYWIRNIPRKSSSFRLQTSKDWFYPDFICQLHDGRILVIEYKGAHIYDANDAEEKRAIGAVWASRSNGKCLFVMPTEKDFSVIAQAVR